MSTTKGSIQPVPPPESELPTPAEVVKSAQILKEGAKNQGASSTEAALAAQRLSAELNAGKR